jgi:hypothetical protein
LEVPLTLLQRIMIHRVWAVLVLLFVLAGSLPTFEGRLYLAGTPAAAIAGMVIVIMLPLRYVFTDTGISLNNGVPRTYKTFRRFTVKPGRRWLKVNTTIDLQGRKLPKGTAPSMKIYVPSTEAPAVTRVLKKHLR